MDHVAALADRYAQVAKTLREGIDRLLEWHESQGTDWAAALTEDVSYNWKPRG